MHGNDDGSADLADHLEHQLLWNRIDPVDRNQKNIDLPEFTQMLIAQRVMQMAKMGDAQIGELEHED